MTSKKRSFVILLSFWLFLCQTGMAWSVSTCLITGQQKVDLGSSAKCCKMPSKSTEGNFSSKISKKPCCKIEQHIVKLNTVHDGKFSEKKNFQSDLKNLQFYTTFFLKVNPFKQNLPLLVPKSFIKSGQFLLKLFQVFII